MDTDDVTNIDSRVSSKVEEELGGCVSAQVEDMTCLDAPVGM